MACVTCCCGAARGRGVAGVRLTAGQSAHDEKRLGSIETGKLADLVVLSDDFFDAQKVPDAAIKRVHSVLTIVGGDVVYNALTSTGAGPIVAVH